MSDMPSASGYISWQIPPVSDYLSCCGSSWSEEVKRDCKPLVKGDVANAILLAPVVHFHTGVCLFKDVDNLLSAEA
jgi:hypothetical protein